MPDHTTPSQLKLRNGAGLSMDMMLFVDSMKRHAQLKRLLIGDEADSRSSSATFRYLDLISIPGVELGRATVSIYTPSRSPYSMRLGISNLEVISANMCRDDHWDVDFGLASAAASAVQLAGAIQAQIELSGADLLHETHGSSYVYSDSLIMESCWAEALGLRGIDDTRRQRRVHWNTIHAFDEQEAVFAVYRRRLELQQTDSKR